MYNNHAALVTALQTLSSNVYYELATTEQVSFPCITYCETNNYVRLDGNVNQVSYISYAIKVWGRSISDVQTLAEAVDAKMFGLGFTRTSSAELVGEDQQICKILNYTGLSYE